MKIQKNQFINQLIQLTEENKNAGMAFLALTDQQLNWKSNPESWSIFECLEHLNRYGEYYLPEIKRVISQAKPSNESIFKSGVLGSYFSKSMLPKENLNTMITFKAMNPLDSSLDRRVLEKFIQQQDELISLLKQAKNIHLKKNKTAISITKLIRFRLGDTFHFVINHIIRHIKQAERIMSQMKNETTTTN